MDRSIEDSLSTLKIAENRVIATPQMAEPRPVPETSPILPSGLEGNSVFPGTSYKPSIYSKEEPPLIHFVSRRPVTDSGLQMVRVEAARNVHGSEIGWRLCWWSEAKIREMEDRGLIVERIEGWVWDESGGAEENTGQGYRVIWAFERHRMILGMRVESLRQNLEVWRERMAEWEEGGVEVRNGWERDGWTGEDIEEVMRMWEEMLRLVEGGGKWKRVGKISGSPKAVPEVEPRSDSEVQISLSQLRNNLELWEEQKEILEMRRIKWEEAKENRVDGRKWGETVEEQFQGWQQSIREEKIRLEREGENQSENGENLSEPEIHPGHHLHVGIPLIEMERELEFWKAQKEELDRLKQRWETMKAQEGMINDQIRGLKERIYSEIEKKCLAYRRAREERIRLEQEGKEPRCPGGGNEEIALHHVRPPMSLHQMRLALEDWFQDQAKLEREIRVGGPGDDQAQYKRMIEVQIKAWKKDIREEEARIARTIVDPGERKQFLGDALFPKIQALQPELAGKITGMLLEIDDSELVHLLDDESALCAMVDEAFNVYNEYVKRRSKEGDAQARANSEEKA